ncbi:hypothetical protein KI659_17615 [Litoribacter alkaliphilus]|uniref:Uncharacterized protein n=1 Tax=Litoribacter ruber TaxID=702568 RepID=A0AAP2CJG7_9BACT|nr:hypothetical protein [Litoribacter alkaliphilus]MBS9525843.1 hypothetical protein [Litoribacter alkaliphilus]
MSTRNTLIGVIFQRSDFRATRRYHEIYTSAIRRPKSDIPPSDFGHGPSRHPSSSTQHPTSLHPTSDIPTSDS